MSPANGMSRPLAWILALTVTVIGVLVFLSPRIATTATPEAEVVEARTEAREAPIELASVPNENRAAVGLEATAVRAPVAGPTLPGSIEVRVVRAEDGVPVAGAEVVIAPYGPWDQIPRVRTEADGTLLREGLELRGWTVRAVAPDRAERVEFVTLDASNPRASVVLELPPAFAPIAVRATRVRVVDSTGQLATAESLGVAEVFGGVFGLAVETECVAVGGKAGGRGRAARDLEVSGYQWNVVRRADEPACLHLILSGGRVLDTHELFFGETQVDFVVNRSQLEETSGTFDVRIVVDATGEPVAGANVSLSTSGSGMWYVQTDSEGRVPSRLVPAGELTIKVLVPGLAAETRFVPIPSAEPVVIRLVACRRIQGIVTDLAGVPVEDVDVAAILEVEGAAGTQQASMNQLASGAGGAFEFKALTRRAYVLAVMPTSLVKARDRLTKQGEVIVSGLPFPAEKRLGSQVIDVRDGDATGIVLRIDRSKL